MTRLSSVRTLGDHPAPESSRPGGSPAERIGRVHLRPDLNATPALGGDSLARGEDAVQVERVGGGEAQGGSGLAFAGGAEEFDGVEKGVLFAGESRDESAAADFTAQFEVTASPDEIPPGQGNSLALQEASLQDAVAS